MTLELPWPPSDNRLIRHVFMPAKGSPWCQRCKRAVYGHVVAYPSEEAKEYRKQVEMYLLAKKLPRLKGTQAVTVDLYPPDHRVIDPANRLKALLDSLKRREIGRRRKGEAPRYDPKQLAWLFATDDSQAVDVHVRLCHVVAGGKAVVTFAPLPQETQPQLFEAEPEEDDCPGVEE